MNCSVCYEHHNVSTSFFSVFPAGAGVILNEAEEQLKKESFPRRCGGDPQILFIIIWSIQVFPAGAGVIPPSQEPNCVGKCFPRRCGGDPHVKMPAHNPGLFSPQVRG